MTIPTSIDELIANEQNYGGLNLLYENYVVSSTTTTTIAQSGFIAQRLLKEWVMPAVTAPVTGALMTECYCSNVNNVITGLEYNLGTWDRSAGTRFSAGVSMPSKVIKNAEAMQMAANYAFLFVETSFTGLVANVTVSCLDQDGNARTLTIAIATSTQVNSCYWLAPYFPSGMTGITAVTNIVVAATEPTAGKFSIRGILPFNTSLGTIPQSTLGNPLLNPPIEPGDKIAQYKLGSTQSAAGSAGLNFFHLTPIL